MGFSIYDILRKLSKILRSSGSLIYRKNNVKIGEDFFTDGFPDIKVEKLGFLYVGKSVKVINSTLFNGIGVVKRSSFYVQNHAVLKIGDYSGLTGVSIFCSKYIEIGDYVLIGANCFIFDTDFHPINPNERIDQIKNDKSIGKSSSIFIEDNVFIGANCIISKGVRVGRNSVISSGSRIVCDIPSNQIWGGNPARFLKTVNLLQNN